MQTKTYKPSAWDLSDLLASTEATIVEAAIAELEVAIQAVEAGRGGLAAEMPVADFHAFLKKY